MEELSHLERAIIQKERRLTEVAQQEAASFPGCTVEHFPVMGKHGYRWKVSRSGHYIGSIELAAEVTLPDAEVRAVFRQRLQELVAVGQ